jgi:hypothetical protein
MTKKTDEKLEQEILNQGQLQQRLKARGLPLSTNTIHACMEAGMPKMVIGENKKPRFHWDQVWEWMITVRVNNPLKLATRDRLYLRQRGIR